MVPFVEAHEKAGAFAPIVNAMAVEAIASMQNREFTARLRSSRRSQQQLVRPPERPSAAACVASAASCFNF